MSVPGIELATHRNDSHIDEQVQVESHEFRAIGLPSLVPCVERRVVKLALSCNGKQVAFGKRQVDALESHEDSKELKAKA